MPITAGGAPVAMERSAVNQSANVRTTLYNAVNFYESLYLETKKQLHLEIKGTAGFDWLI
jgi:2-keto-3-deoxy-L-rhamnonate aldolase RhmA